MLKSGQNRGQLRSGVGAFILNKSRDSVFVATRANDVNYKNKGISDEFSSNMQADYNKDSLILQMPQGGIDNGETAENALMREIYEEIGVKSEKLVLLDKSAQLHSYIFPAEIARRVYNGRYLGQSLQWFCLEYKGEDADIRLDTHEHVEFINWRWLPAVELPYYAIDFKRNMYASLLAEFSSHVRG